VSPDMLPWILARAGGIVAYLLLAGAMAAGLMVRSRTRVLGLTPGQLVAAHGQLSLLALVAVGVHGASLVADTFVDVSPLALVVPGLVPYRAFWTALGVIGMELLLIVQVTSRIRGHIGVRAWRRLHMLAYGAFALATVHGITAGTDTGRPWVLAMYASAVGIIAALTTWRVARAPRRSTRRRQARKDGVVGPATATHGGPGV